MRILRVSSTFPPIVDGRAHHVLGLSRAQADAGDEVTLYQPHAPAGSHAAPGLTVERIDTKRAPETIFASKRTKLEFAFLAARAAERRARDYWLENTVLHAHGEIWECMALRAVRARTGLPLVLTVHAGLNRTPQYRLLAAPVFRIPDHIIAVAEPIAEQLRALGVPRHRLSVISSGIAADRIADGHRARSPATVLLAVGRLQEMKGYEYLLQALRLLGANAGGLELRIAGDGPDRERIARAAAGLPNVRLLGEQRPDDVRRELAQADLFVLASVDLPGQTEGTPTAAMEAMAAGLPIVCTDAGGLPQLIRNGENGVIVPQRDPPALAKAIERLLHDDAARAQMARNNVAAARDRAWPAIAQRVAEAYRRAAHERREHR